MELPFPPARNLNVVAVVEPDTTLLNKYIGLKDSAPPKGEAPGGCPLKNDVLIAFAVESLNNAVIITSETLLFSPTKQFDSTYKIEFEYLGVMVQVITSFPTVCCGIVLSAGIGYFLLFRL